MLEAPPPPCCIINTAEFLEWAKCFEHLVKGDGLLKDPQELKTFNKKMLLVFVLGMHTRKICHSRKDDDSMMDVPRAQ